MIVFPQRGACLCGDIEYCLDEDPLTLYACHCTDCQRQTAARSPSMSSPARMSVPRARPQMEKALVGLTSARVPGATPVPVES